MQYRHTITVTREAAQSGSRNDFGDPVTPTADTAVLTAQRCDVQDGAVSYRERVELFGSESIDGGARVFFPPGFAYSTLITIQTEDDVSATFEGTTRAGEVIDIDLLDKTLLVKWLAVNP